MPAFIWKAIVAGFGLSITLSGCGAGSGGEGGVSGVVEVGGTPAAFPAEGSSGPGETSASASISIRVTSPEGGLEGVRLTLQGREGTSISYTDANGNVQFSMVPEGSYLLRPFKVGYTFHPADRSFTLSPNGITSQDFEARKASSLHRASIAAGGIHSLALKTNGSLWAWGSNYDEQLGVGELHVLKSITPLRVGTGSNWRSLAAGLENTLALQADGTMWGWGGIFYENVSYGSSPVQIGEDRDWTAASSGDRHQLSLKQDGSLWAWGRNQLGQLGDGTGADRSIRLIRVGAENDWAMAAAGSNHTVALKGDGTLWAWGWNTDGQLGEGTNTDRFLPVRIGADNDWTAVGAGHAHTLALKADGSLWAWGANDYGQLGDGTGIGSIHPVRIGSDKDWVGIGAGYVHSLARKADGTIWAWGWNLYGQLGDGTNLDQFLPVQVGREADWTAVAAGYGHTLARKGDGTLWAWGRNIDGTLGDGTEADRNHPSPVGAESDWGLGPAP